MVVTKRGGSGKIKIKEKKMGSLFEIGSEERLKGNQLIKLERLIDWGRIERILNKVHKRDENPTNGGFSYNKLGMFKAVLLGQWHSLSDPGLEEAIRIRLDFMAFTGFGLGEKLPDETTLCRFRNKLIAKGIDKLLFEEINKQLEELGIKISKADKAIVDATIIESSARPNKMIEIAQDREEDEEIMVEEGKIKESADNDARWLKKGNKSYFGYKAFVATDNKGGFITKAYATPANRAEVSELMNITEHIKKGVRVLADKGYASQSNREMLKDRGLKDGIMYKTTKNSTLSNLQKIFNKLVSKTRFIVEQTFGTLKRKFCFQRASYRGVHKVTGQLIFKSICFNLLKALNFVKIVT